MGLTREKVLKGHLSFLIGLPRSDKSSFADIWVKNFDFDKHKDCFRIEVDERFGYHFLTTGTFDRVTQIIIDRPRVIICGDDFRKALYGRDFCPVGEGHVFACMDTAARALLARGFDVLIDETSTTEETILRYLRIDPEATPIWIDTPGEICKQRAIEDKKEYLLGPIDRMWAQLLHLKENWQETYPRLKEKVLARVSQDTDTINIK